MNKSTQCICLGLASARNSGGLLRLPVSAVGLVARMQTAGNFMARAQRVVCNGKCDQLRSRSEPSAESSLSSCRTFLHNEHRTLLEWVDDDWLLSETALRAAASAAARCKSAIAQQCTNITELKCFQAASEQIGASSIQYVKDSRSHSHICTCA